MIKQILLFFVAAFAATSTAITTSANEETLQTLTMAEAVRLALSSDDPYLMEPAERAGALDDQAVADAQLPDPKLRMTFANWPTNSFSYSQEPMTQVQVGLSQAFPRGSTLVLRRQQRQAQARGERLMQQLRAREIALDTRQSWLDLYYWVAAKSKVQQSRQAVVELIGVIQANFATGRNTSQDIFRSEMELGLLDDRFLEIERQEAMVRARLSRRIGQIAAQREPRAMPALRHPSSLAVLEELIEAHPAAELRLAQVDAADKEVDIAGERYKPGWAVNVGYGARGGDRADFATVGVVMDVPLFTKNRQDRQVSAAKQLRQAQRLSRDGVMLDLNKRLRSSYAGWLRLQDRIALYQSVVVERAKETAQASLTSYQSGVTDFPELIRSRLAELDSELKLLKLQSEKLKTQSELLFFEGEEDA